MKIAVVSNFDSEPDSLRIAWDISRAWRPTCVSPISPSISARGTSAATESITTRCNAPDRTNMSAISSACSPESGCETSSSSMLTPSSRAYVGSSACSASMNAAMPPCCCASAMMCRQTVVLPDPSGPKTSTTRPRGIPPTPSAISNASDPVGIVPKPSAMGCSPSFMTAPLPCCFSICWSVTSNILSRSTRSPFRSRPTPEEGRMSAPAERSSTLASGSDISYTPVIRRADRVHATRTYVRKQGSSRSGDRPDEGKGLQGLGPGRRSPEVAPEQHDPVDRERDGGEGRGEALREADRRVASRDGEVGGERAGLRSELSSQRLVQRGGDPAQGAGLVIHPGPQHPRAAPPGEGPHPGEACRRRSVPARDVPDPIADPALESGPRLTEELHRHVPVLAGDPASLRERRRPRLHGAGDGVGGVGGHVEGNEEAERPRLRPAVALARHLGHRAAVTLARHLRPCGPTRGAAGLRGSGGRDPAPPAASTGSRGPAPP